MKSKKNIPNIISKSFASAPPLKSPLLSPRAYRNIVFMLLGIAILIRLVTFISSRNMPDITPDGTYYRTVSATITSGEFFKTKPVFTFSPLYVFVLAAIKKITGSEILVVRLLQHICGVLSCLLIFLIARIIAGRRAAIVALVAACLYQPFIIMETQILSVSIVLSLMLASLYCVVRVCFRNRPPWLLGVGGFLLSLAALGAPNMMVLVPVIGVWILMIPPSAQPWPVRIRRTLFFLLGTIIPLVPTTLWNYHASGEFIPISAQGGINLFIGNNPKAIGVFEAPPGMVGSMEGINMIDSKRVAEADAHRSLKYSEVSSYWARKGMAFITGEPDAFVRLFLRKVFLFVNNFETPDNIDPAFVKQYAGILRLPLLSFGFVAALGLLGILCSLFEWRRYSLALLCLVGYSFSVVIFFVVSRYRLPAVPLFILFAGVAIARLIDLFRSKRYGWMALAILALCFFGALVFSPTGFKVAPDSIWFNLSVSCKERGDIRGQIDALEKCILVDPESIDARWPLAQAYYGVGELNKAQQQLLWINQRSPRYAEVHRLLAAIGAKLGNGALVWQELMLCLRYNPECSGAMDTLRTIDVQKRFHIKPGDTTAADVPKTFLDSLFNTGDALFRSQQYENALDTYHRFQLYVPDNLDIKYRIGIIYSRMNMPGNAVIMFRQVLAANPQYVRAIKEMAAMYCFQLQAYDSATTYVKRYFEENPNDPDCKLMEQRLSELRRLVK